MSSKPQHPTVESLQPKFEFRPPGSLRINNRNARVHPKRQIRKIANSIAAIGHIVPIVTDENGVVLKGHASLAAAKLLNLPQVPTLIVSGLSEAQKRSFMIADNRLALDAGWDFELLAEEFDGLADLLRPIDLDLTITGFEPAEIDIVFADRQGEHASDQADAVPGLQHASVTRPGDLWRLRQHRLLCGDAGSARDLDLVMGGERARMVFTDPPYNLRIRGHVRGRGRTQHREFPFASGEMSEEQYSDFLAGFCQNVARACEDGAIAFTCIDWRHIEQMLKAGRAAFTELKNIVVWNKTSPGQGTFYRSQHELILVWKLGKGPHVNAFGLGQHGRTRSNVWTYAGTNSFRAGRDDELRMHPTVKPVALVADAMRDCSIKADIVLDVFLGSGTTIMAAEKIGRRGYGIEYDPAYVDLAIRRWQQYTKADAVLEGAERNFDELEAERRDGSGAPPASQAAEQTAAAEGYFTEQEWIEFCSGPGRIATTRRGDK